MTNIINYKRLAYVLLSVVLIAVTVLSLLSSGGANVSAQNIKMDDDTAQIFVGSTLSRVTIAEEAQKNPDLLTGDDAEKYYIIDEEFEETYKTERNAFLNNLQKTQGDKFYSSVLNLSDYYSVQEVNEFIVSQRLNVNRVYLWIPGETGRISLSVENNDIEGAIAAHLEKYAEKNIPDEQLKADYERIIAGEFGIFSITVDASAKALNDLQNSDFVDFIDVKYNPEAESVAKEAGKTIQYIELPSKPDGAY